MHMSYQKSIRAVTRPDARRPISTRAVSAVLAIALAGPALADPRTVYLEDQSGARLAIADLETTEGVYTISLREALFSDHFLSMRPFKCLTGPDKHWCYVPYPYENARDISDDLTDLEYDLLFIWKGAGEYGINMWNGVYYVLSEEDGRLTGAMYEMDMDVLSAPPEAGNLRPIRDRDLEPAEPESHWLPRLVIE